MTELVITRARAGCWASGSLDAWMLPLNWHPKPVELP
jgi:hypothetical protein